MIRNITFCVTATLLIILIGGKITYSQCCSGGCPIGASTYNGVLEKNNLQTMISYRNGHSENYFRDNVKLLGYPNPIKFLNFYFLDITIGYGILKNITIENTNGYFINKIQHLEIDSINKLELKANGAANGILMIKYNLYYNLKKDIEITIGAGIKYPLSTKLQYNNGVLLSQDITTFHRSYRSSTTSITH